MFKPYDNVSQTSYIVTNVQPYKNHFVSDSGTIVASFADNDNVVIHIRPETAAHIVDWANGILETFKSNGLGSRIIPSYGMFSCAGDTLVHHAVIAAKSSTNIWTVENVRDEVVRLAKNSHVNVQEVYDTAVGDMIYLALEDKDD